MLVSDQTEYPKFWLRAYNDTYKPGLVYMVEQRGAQPRYLHPHYAQRWPQYSSEYGSEHDLEQNRRRKFLGADQHDGPVRAISRQEVVQWFAQVDQRYGCGNIDDVNDNVAQFLREARHVAHG